MNVRPADRGKVLPLPCADDFLVQKALGFFPGALACIRLRVAFDEGRDDFLDKVAVLWRARGGLRGLLGGGGIIARRHRDERPLRELARGLQIDRRICAEGEFSRQAVETVSNSQRHPPDGWTMKNGPRIRPSGISRRICAGLTASMPLTVSAFAMFGPK